MNDEQINSLSITARLLAKEAVERGWRLTAFKKTVGLEGNSVIKATRDGKTLYFKGLHTLATSSVARYLSEDKVGSYSALGDAGLPIPKTFIIERDVARQQEIEIDQEIFSSIDLGTKFVVKPSNTDHGDGVTVGVDSSKSILGAIKYALDKSYDADILVQRQVSGKEYRFLVLKDKVIAVAHRQPPFVIGDGLNNIKQLIEIKNSDPRRGAGHDSELTKVDLDEVSYFIGPEEMLRVPTVDETVELLRTSNLSRGGESIDYTDVASESLQDIAVKAAKSCLLGIAGVDIITRSIENGNENDSFVIEVNASAGIRMHQFPSIGKPRNIASMIFDELEKNAIINE